MSWLKKYNSYTYTTRAVNLFLTIRMRSVGKRYIFITYNFDFKYTNYEFDVGGQTIKGRYETAMLKNLILCIIK